MAPDYARIEEDALETLEALCRSPSVSAEARALDETAELVEEMLGGAGFATRRLEVDGGPAAVYGEQAGAKPYTLLLYNHYDVQPVDPLELWESPPFEPTIRDGKLYARGAADNKAELAVRLAVLRALREESGGLPVGIRWIVEGEEEVGSPHFEEIVRENVELLRADAGLWEGSAATLEDGRPGLTLGFKGVLAVRLDVRLLSSDVHSATAAIVGSAAWRLVEALTTLRSPDGTILIPGFYDAVRAPTDAERQAIEEASEVGEHALRKILGIDEFVGGVTGAALRERLSFTPTCNIAGIKTGYSGPGVKTVLPAEASAWLDFRLVPGQKPGEILELLVTHLGRVGLGDVEVTPLAQADPAGIPVEHPFTRRIARVAETVTGAPASITPIGAGTLPIVAPLERHAGVLGVGPPDNPVYIGSHAHAPNEHVRLDDIGPAVRFTYALLHDLAQD